nr:hypothetical protein [Lachnospiraceae bacterium]
VVYSLDELTGGTAATYSAKDSDYWRIINIFVADDIYYGDTGMRKPVMTDSYNGIVGYDEENIKLIISALDPDFTGDIDRDALSRSENVDYNASDGTYNFGMGDKGEVDSVVSGFIDHGDGTGEVYGYIGVWVDYGVYDELRGYCRIDVVPNSYEAAADSFFPLSVKSASIISEGDYRSAQNQDDFIKINN